MAAAQQPQRLGLAQAHRISERLAIGAQATLLGAVLHQAHAAPQCRLHDRLQLRRWAGDQIQPALEQQLAAAITAAAGPQQLHLQVVKRVADGGRLRHQGVIHTPAEFLQHPQRLLHPAAVGCHHLAGLLALRLGGMAEAGAPIAGGVAGLFVAVGMQQAKPLAQILQPRHQVRAIQAEPAPVLHHAQAFTGAVEVGVQQAPHRRCVVRGRHGLDQGEAKPNGLRRVSAT